MTLLISDDDVRATADMPGLVDAVESVLHEEYDGLITMPPRVNVTSDGTVLRLMPAHLAAVTSWATSHFTVLWPRVSGISIVLIRADDGEILALIDAALLTALRTGATSGVATRYWRARVPRMSLSSAPGLEAETNLAGVAAVRPISRVRVFSPKRATAGGIRPSRRRDRSERRVIAAASAEDAVSGADIVIVRHQHRNTRPGRLSGRLDRGWAAHRIGRRH